MKALLRCWIVIMLAVSSYCTCCNAQHAAQNYLWIAWEDNGDKPGIEYRLWFDKDTKIAAEMWLFIADGKGKDTERSKYPITITDSDHQSITFTYTSSTVSQQVTDKLTIILPDGRQLESETGLLVTSKDQPKISLLFRRVKKVP